MFTAIPCKMALRRCSNIVSKVGFKTCTNYSNNTSIFILGNWRHYSLTSMNALFQQSSGSISLKSSQYQCFSSSGTRHKDLSNDITKVKDSEIQTATFSQKTKENVKTASYGMVIVVGIGVTSVVLYTVLKELFSRDSFEEP